MTNSKSRTKTHPNNRIGVFLLAHVILAAGVLFGLSLTAHAAQKTPEEVYANRPNNLEILPDGWVTQNPIELVVSFNLKSAPNTPEADAFLQTWYDSISALPYDVDLEMRRQVSPSQYAYSVSLKFNNWEEYREYESAEDFLAYYYEHWKPYVADAEERVYILDTVVTPRS